ncbi:MAG TPA: homoserine dehydrogenase [Flavobacteriales bacterium]|nr:homoserine dehydrogenase [Flavobacteriales bacterium]HRE96174.1 homoserine dehydrogenase [Flavobacteriales bacterium]HRJ35901.1 homoserine dehydrogenase [Flavobacteriales bacterium]HRJ37493.1 homoserine dehydrogenase [Flavobacteriales bacterium]
MEHQVKIGLFGFGCVGQGLYDVLSQSRGFRTTIKRIVVKDPSKKRSLPASMFAYDKNEILNDPEINLVVELIDNAKDAYEIVSTALRNGKNVVSANKKMIAENFEELVRLQHEFGTSLLYEASSCGSIPILRNLEEYYDNELLRAVSGIFNGSSNYILTKVQNEHLDYATALRQAQELGFAESDPTLDVEGFDAKYKLVIITGHTFGVFARPEDVLNLGIGNLAVGDVEFAQSRGKRIRLVANTFQLDDQRISLFVTPRLVAKDDQLYNVNNEYNAVILEAAFSDKQLFVGKGAGGHPTGSAVLSDISANAYHYRYEYKKYHQQARFTYSTEIELEVYLRSNDPVLFDEIGFTSISERGINYVSGVNYVIGTIGLKDLIRHRERINASGSFLAATGEVIVLDGSRKERKQLSESVGI